jgi:hypothetical protein
MIRRLIRKFCETSSACNRKHSSSPTVLSDDTLQDTFSLLHSPSNSRGKLSQKNAHKTTKVKLRACRAHATHELRPVCVTVGLIAFVRNNTPVLDIFFSGERLCEQPEQSIMEFWELPRLSADCVAPGETQRTVIGPILSAETFDAVLLRHPNAIHHFAGLEVGDAGPGPLATPRE